MNNRENNVARDTPAQGVVSIERVNQAAIWAEHGLRLAGVRFGNPG